MKTKKKSKIKEKYYYIVNKYEESGQYRSTGHVVRANSEREADEICEKYGIANPMGAKVESRKIELINPKIPFGYFDLIDRRRKGIGGKIFYEQDNQLKIEKG